MSSTLLTLLLAAAEVPEAEAAAHGHGELDWFWLGSMFLNLILLFTLIVPFVFKMFVGKSIKQALHDRRETFAVLLREAQQKQAEAEKRLAEYQHKLENLEEEVARIMRAFEAEGEAERVRIRADADRAVERLVREVDFTIRQESFKAQKEIREAAVKATVELAEKLISERITDADRRRLADDYISQVAPPTTGLPRGEPSS